MAKKTYLISGKLVMKYVEREVEADDIEDAKRQLESEATGEWEDFEADELEDSDSDD